MKLYLLFTNFTAEVIERTDEEKGETEGKEEEIGDTEEAIGDRKADERTYIERGTEVEMDIHIDEENVEGKHQYIHIYLIRSRVESNDAIKGTFAH